LIATRCFGFAVSNIRRRTMSTDFDSKSFNPSGEMSSR